jgi:hypothetical protein
MSRQAEKDKNIFKLTLKLLIRLPLKKQTAIAEWQNCDRCRLAQKSITLPGSAKRPRFLPGSHREPVGFVRQTPMGPSRRSLTENTDFLQFEKSFSTVRIYLIGNTTAAETMTGETT